MPFFGLNFKDLFARLKRQLQNQEQFNDPQPFDWDWDLRRDSYSRWEKLYANSIYLDEIDGGFRETILTDTIKLGATESDEGVKVPISGFFNPTRTICEAYQNVFRGVWGDDIKPMKRGKGGDLEEFEPGAKLPEALTQIWKWSNLDTKKQTLLEWAPLYGTVGLRVEARPSEDPLERRVRIHLDNPARIIDFDEDSNGNVRSVLLRYMMMMGPLGEKRRAVKVEELITKERFIVKHDDVTVFNEENALGVCPYVLLRHKNIGADWGVPAFWGSEDIIHWLNWRITRQDTSIDRHQFPKWFASGAGQAPDKFKMEETLVAYVQTQTGDPAPTLEALVPTIDQSNALAFWQACLDLLRERQPEMLLNNLKALSGQSGETIAKLLKPAEQRIELAKANYEDAMRRILQIGVSWGIMLGIVDLDTGQGDRTAADQAFNTGQEEFGFNKRSPLPEDVYDTIQRAQAETARRKRDLEDANSASNIVSEKETLRIAGYSDKEIEQILKDRAEQDVIPGVNPEDSPIPPGRIPANGNGAARE